MEHDTFIKTFACQKDKVVNRLWGFICKKLDDHGAFIGLHAGFVSLLGIDLHWGWVLPLFCHIFSPYNISCSRESSGLCERRNSALLSRSRSASFYHK